MESKLSRWCEGFLEAAWLAALIATPLFFNIHSDRVFEPDKITLLRSLALLMALVWLVKFIDQRGWKDLSWLKWKSKNSIWRQPLILPLTAIVLVYIISTLISVAPRTSLLGSYQRLQGTYSTFSYIVIFAVIASTMRTKEQLQRVVTVVIITSIPVALYGILQRMELDPLPWGGNTSRRIAGHMGNAIFVGAYLILAIPLTATRIIDGFYNILTDEELSYSDVIRSSIYLLAIVLQLMAVYFTQSRGPLLGLAIGLFAFVLILLVSLRNAADKSRKNLSDSPLWALVMGVICVLALYLSSALIPVLGSRFSFIAYSAIIGVLMLVIFILAAARIGWRWLWAAWLVVIGYIGAVILVFNISTISPAYFESPLLSPLDKTFDVWREQPTINRVGDMLNQDAGTSTVRLLIWSGVIELITPHEPINFLDGETDRWNVLRPLFGYGPESMYVAYNRFYPPELATLEARNASPDRSHNETFDALVITGVVGFLAWQAFYLATFLYAFKILGVVQQKRDNTIFISLWIIGAICTAGLLVAYGGMVYLGIAIPLGSILGLVVYLIYYALRRQKEEIQQRFDLLRLLMVGLVAALIAYYVEIHFGIAIAATRTHSFVYIALIYVLGTRLSAVESEALEKDAVSAESETEAAAKPRRRARRVATSSGNSGPIIAATLILTFLMMNLAFNFINFTPRPDEADTWNSASDLPSATEIFERSMLVNPREEFIDSPYLYAVYIASWMLGALLLVSEMTRQGVLNIGRMSVQKLGDRKTIVLALVAGLAVVGIFITYLGATASPMSRFDTLARTLGAVWVLLSGAVIVVLLRDPIFGRKCAAALATIGILFAMPLFLVGLFWQPFLLATLSLATLYFTWDKSWQYYFVPLLTVAGGSFVLSSIYALIHSSMIRSSFIAPSDANGPLQGLERNIVEAERIGAYLSYFYSFTIALLLAAGLAMVWNSIKKSKNGGNTYAYIALGLMLLVGFFMVDRTNINIVQADMTYKRGKPYDQQAVQLTRSLSQQEPAQQEAMLEASIDSWKSAIAIYERAVEMAPSEDFYYLWLGRGYLEESSINDAEQTELLETAKSRLIEAQGINPLNTDHTANLARLNVRWAQLVDDESESAEKIADADYYYVHAMALSPQNSIIRNEYAGLALSLEEDCVKTIHIYKESLRIDPYYDQTYYRLAETYIACGRQEDPPRVAFFADANDLLDSMDDNMPERMHERIKPRVTQIKLQIAQAYLLADETEPARAIIDAIDEAELAAVQNQVDSLLEQIELLETTDVSFKTETSSDE